MLKKKPKTEKIKDASVKEYTYRFRIYPNTEQLSFLIRQIGSIRFVYNFLLERNSFLYRVHKIRYDYGDMQNALKLMKKGFPFLDDMNSQSLQGALVNLDNAFKRFFKHESKYPKFKSKKKLNAVSIPQHFKLDGNKLYIPKLKSPFVIKYRKRKPQETVKKVSISLTATGKFYVNMSVEKVFVPMPYADNVAGLDLGIKTFATITSGINEIDKKTDKIDNPKYYLLSQKRLIKIQRKLSKKQHPRYKGDKTKRSNNFIKESKKLAKVYEHQTNQLTDFAHKRSLSVINDNQVIMVEDLNITGMLKNRHLAKAIQNVAWSRFVDMLEYKAGYYGRTFQKVSRTYPSSKTCSTPGCGYVNKDLKLSDRFWYCPQCKTLHDRDENASVNMFMKALEVRRVSPEPSERITPEEIAIADIRRLAFTKAPLLCQPKCAVPFAASTLKSGLSMRQEALSVRAR